MLRVWRSRFGIVLLAALGLCGAEAPAEEPLSLWYRKPAKTWVEALPVGNGRIGAMMFGGIAQERLQFNEDTVWTGEPHEYQHRGASQYLGQLRQLLYQGRQKEAEALAMEHFMSVPLRQRAYQSFGDLMLDFPNVDEKAVSGYRRDLNLDAGVASLCYQVGDISYQREVFASFPDQVLVVRLLADRPGEITFRASFRSAHEGAVFKKLGNDQLSFSDGVPGGAIRFEARLLVKTDGGSVQATDAGISVTGANSTFLFLAAATNFKSYKDVSADPKLRNDATIASVRGKSYPSPRAAHVADHQIPQAAGVSSRDRTPGAHDHPLRRYLSPAGTKAAMESRG